MTDANTAHNGGFIRLITRRGIEYNLDNGVCDVVSIDRTLNAGNEVRDSLESECVDRRSIDRRRSSIAPNVETDLVERLVDI